ncbi:MAG: MliC family protein [Thermodesulfobacteriota bacterium]
MSLLLEKVEKGFLSLFVIVIALISLTSYTHAQGPSFDCGKVEAGSIEETICKDPALSALDRKMAKVYKEAEKKAVNEKPPVLKAEQRGWIKGRNDCWKSEDVKECIKLNYTLRIAELEARYALVDSKGPFFYACDGNPSNEVVMTFYETDPQTLVAEYGDSTSLMYIEPSGSGSKYQGRNESAWIKGNEARVKWGFDSQTMNCKQKQ